MEKLDKLLLELANKLGTTVEYLWNILIKQAYINGIQCIVFFLLTSLLGFVLWRVHLIMSKPMKGESVWNRYDDNEYIVMAMIISFFLWLMLFLASIFCLFDACTAILNPEYWALDKILQTIN